MKTYYKEIALDSNSNKIRKELYKIDNIYDYKDFLSWNKYYDLILHNFSEVITHIWLDNNDWRKKIYISLYDLDFKNSLKIINSLKKILKIEEKYFLEKNFLKFDCIWIDFFKNWKINLKIYEILKKDDFFWLPDFCDKCNVKEIWFLKDFSWRKKKFFRFEDYLEIKDFWEIFDLSEVLENKNIKWKVKYFCIEWTKKEIYFL